MSKRSDGEPLDPLQVMELRGLKEEGGGGISILVYCSNGSPIYHKL